MNVFFEEDGDFKVGTVLADNNTSLQVETLHGKRAKIKAANVLIRFNHGPLAQFMAEAQGMAAEIDAGFLWECSGDAEFSFEQLGREYFGREPRPEESAALLVRLHATPTHFYKKGKGRYKAAPAEALKAALAGIERRKRQAELQERYAEQLLRCELPDEFRPRLQELLYAPDKGSTEYKALEQASGRVHLSFPKLLEKCGALPSSHDYHFGRFLFEYFPRGTQFPADAAPGDPGALELAPVEAFSIDDSDTTEIDDAFSVTKLPGGNWQVGIHIAAPALGLPVGSVADREGAKRLSTVYFPGNKITMLPPAVIDRFTLSADRDCAALSLYVELSPDLEVRGTRSVAERVRIAANLRHDALEAEFNEKRLAAGNTDYRFGPELALLWKLAGRLEKARGKEESASARTDYNFYVEDDRVRIVERKRGSPIDKVVSELMILVNTEWARQLSANGIPALYRVQGNGKVKISTVPAAHQGLGVPHYVWASSPLRRYADLVNQRQLLALFRNEPTPYPQGDERLLVILRDFELAYDAYAEFQRHMERYWCLRWLLQEGMQQVAATVIRDDLVRLEPVPYITRVASLPAVPAGTRVELGLSAIELLEVNLRCEFKQVLEPQHP
jgi:exoribonuclease II